MSFLSGMPELVMENIIWFSDFRSVLTLRQVCQNFRNFIDRLNDSKLPDSKIVGIDVKMKNDIRLSYVPDVPYKKYQSQTVLTFIYSESKNSRSFNGKTTVLEHSNILDVGIRDLEQVLKFQKSTLGEFNFHVHQLSNDLTFPNLHVKLSNMFEKLDRKIKTERLNITSDNQTKIMSILPFADPETLKILNLFSLNGNMEIEMDEIVEAEQWKSAERIKFDFYALNIKVEDICHVSTFHGKMLHISARALDFLKNTFTTSFKSVWWKLQVKNFEEKEEISNLWGPAFFENSSSCWYFRIKDSNEKCLKLELRDNLFNFHFMKLNDVSNRAHVHEYNDN